MGEEGRKERITMGESANTDDALSTGVGEIRFGHVADATARRGARVWLCLRPSHVRLDSRCGSQLTNAPLTNLTKLTAQVRQDAQDVFSRIKVP